MDTALKRLQVGIMKRVGARGAKFFTGGTRRGESSELQADLNSGEREREKAALKRIIANMTLGRDVSQLFTDVVKLGQSTNFETKKLVYLYVLNNAKLQPEKALMAVNTFLQDTQHSSPIVRALAIRTMMCLRVPSVLEYTVEPLRLALVVSEDAYVRKTATVALGKLFHQDSDLFIQQGFLETLLGLLCDSFPIVASNAAAVLNEINASGRLLKTVRKEWADHLLTALGECTEWGQVYVLELLSHYSPSSEEAPTLIERIVPRFSHSSPAVVLAAIKAVAVFIHRLPTESQPPFVARINTALLTFASADPETQYTVCRGAHQLLNVFPLLLHSHLETFYIRFTDPIYVKREKLRLLLRIVTSATALGLVSELSEYANEVDPLFVTQVVLTIAALGVKIEKVAPRCAELLLTILEQRPDMLPSVVSGAKDVLRKYPPLVPDVLPQLMQHHASAAAATEDAKVAFVWMLGEFCDFVDNGQAVLQEFLAGFLTHEVSVQLALLTAAIKLFLRNPQELEKTIQGVLELATQRSTSPDLRDRAFLYWRLLSKGIGVAKMKQIVHGRQAPVVVERTAFDQLPPLQVLHNFNLASGCLGRTPQTFLAAYGLGRLVDDSDDSDAEEPDLPRVEPLDNMEVTTVEAREDPRPQHADPLGALFASPPDERLPTRRVEPSAGHGVGHYADLQRGSQGLCIRLALHNTRPDAVDDAAMQINRNCMSLLPSSQLSSAHIASGHTHSWTVPLTCSPSHRAPAQGSSVGLDIAVKTSAGVTLFTIDVPVTCFFMDGETLEKNTFARAWQMPNNQEAICQVPPVQRAVLQQRYVRVVASIPGSPERLFLSACMWSGESVLGEVAGSTLTSRSASDEGIVLLQHLLQ